MAQRTQYQGNNDVGVYAKLTNSYCLVPISPSDCFFNDFESELSDTIPVIHTTINEIQSVGRISAGNRHGLLLPINTKDNELMHIRNSLPDNVEVHRIEERLSALGNIILCNDHFALVNPALDKNTIDLISDVLQVTVFPMLIGDQGLCGSYAVLTNQGCMVHPGTSREQMKELACLLNLPVCSGTVNQGVASVGGGLVANDWIAFTGLRTTATEISIIDKIFKLDATKSALPPSRLKDAIVEEMT
ncbi:eukaryotic translation initiation factor 6 [Cichlidogyrus casuarinus]|uniref:Eukaryotic translation initiation factor 6 n=1 Tax=Cichlidogyrus casuarinus TaxID=1844966 RepID=A0ABD2PN29_9PLAT